MNARRSLALAVVLVGCSPYSAGEGGVRSPDAGGSADASAEASAEAGAAPDAASICHALSFDGVDDYVEVPDAADLDPVGPSTIESWIELRNDRNSEQHVVSHHDHDKQLGYLLMVFGYGRDSLDGGVAELGASARYYDGVGSQQLGFGSMSTIRPNEWTHIAVSYDGVVLRLYVNGEPRVSQPPARDPPNADLPSVLRIGRGVYGAFHFGGLIDEVRISKVARYGDVSFVPRRRFETDADTVALWHFDEGEGEVAGDATGLHPGAIYGASWVEAPCR